MRSLSTFLLFLLVSALALRANENPINLIVGEYKETCLELQEEDLLPFIDEDLEPPKKVDTQLTLDPNNVYQIDITPEGKKAVVLVADFHCPGFGSLGCGITGYCTTYLIVEDQVFELGARGTPRSAHAGDETFVIVSVAGYMCEDSYGKEGYGAAPCYQAIYWDDEKDIFWSVEGAVKLRGDLSPP